MINKPFDITEDDMMGEVSQPEDQHIKTNKINTEEKLIDTLDHDALSAKLTEIEDKALSEKLILEEKLLQALADLENFRKQSEKRLQDAHKYSVSKLLENLVPVLDSLEQGLNINQEINLETPENNLAKNMHDGMAMTLQILLKALEKFGVKVIEPVINKDIFNPAYHEVMLAQENPDVAPNIIISVMQKGYLLHDRLIRPARVIVSKAVK